MAGGGSLQLSHELGTLMTCVHTRPNACKRSEMKTRGRSPGILLSSCTSQHDAWSLYVSERIYRTVYHDLYRYNLSVCRAFAMPSSGHEIPLIKNATLALTRSYNTLRQSPLPLQLVPAIGIIAFAVWGLEPLLRYSRSLFFHKNDGNWKKSRTHYIFAAYFQPLLLWTGATLVCRALDPVVLPSEASQAVKQRLLIFVRSLSTVLAFAYCLSSLIQQTQKFFLEMSGVDDTRTMGFQFAGKAVYTAVWVAAFSLFMELLGFSTQKWVTAGGLGTVLLTLAGREIFTNFLSSVMIHATRPFVVNEWIQTKIEGYEVSGTVEHVGWWSPTIIRGDDREAVHIPNHKFTVSVVRNLSQKTHWRIKTHLAISHLDVNKINNIVADMRKVLAKNPQIEQQRLHRRVFLDNINPENQALLILVSCFVKTSHFEEYLCVKEAVLLDLLRVISHHRARLATPIRTMQKVYTDADMENIPVAETIFTHPAASTTRPLFLVEPSTRINSEDKAKARPTSHANNEQATKTSPTSELKAVPSSEAPGQNNLNMQHQKENSEATGPSVTSGGEKPSLSEAVSESDRPPSPSPLPPVSRPAFEDNIVLGVALEGSKRMLPIEEGMDTMPATGEASELGAGRNGTSSSPSSTDRKGQRSAPPGAATEQRDKERKGQRSAAPGAATEQRDKER